MLGARGQLGLLVLGAVLGLTRPAPAATAAFLQLGTLRGESTDYAHAGEIEVLGWSWGLAKAAGTNPASLGNLVLTKYVDSSSPGLLKACANRQSLDSAVLTLRTTGLHPLVGCRLVLTKVLVVGLSPGGSGGEARLTETVALNFDALQETYTPLSNPVPQTGFQFNWDVVQNAGLSTQVPLAQPQPVAILAATLAYTNSAPAATLTWQALAGQSYQVWRGDTPAGPFQPYGSPTRAGPDGPLSLPLPAPSARQFFRVESLSAQ